MNTIRENSSKKGVPQLSGASDFEDLARRIMLRRDGSAAGYIDFLLLENNSHRLSELLDIFRQKFNEDHKGFSSVSYIKAHIKYREKNDKWHFERSGDEKDPVVRLTNLVGMNEGFYDQLIKFLEQAKTDNLKTKHFVSLYKGTGVKVSFGQGAPARIPWISFLIEPHTTSKGIYPVYLYYKEYDILILAYGVSETNPPLINWPEANLSTTFS